MKIDILKLVCIILVKLIINRIKKMFLITPFDSPVYNFKGEDITI